MALYEDDDRRNMLSKGALKRAENYFDISVSADKYTLLYKKLAKF